MKRIFSVSSVKNESDIIESFCRYNLSYCDGMLIRDNGSSDNTKWILEKLVDEGLPIYLFTQEDAQAHSQILRTHLAFDKYGADLVIPLDADEFLYHIDGINPRETLESLSEYVEYQVPWRTYVYEKEPDIKLGFMPNNFTHYRNPVIEKAGGHAGNTLTSRYLIKEKQSKFTGGAHWLIYPDKYKGTVTIENPEKLVCAHFPIRSNVQIKKQVIPNAIDYMRKNKNTIPFEQVIPNHQTGILYKEFISEGDICNDKMTQNSVEYSLYNLGNREEIAKLISTLGDQKMLYGPMNTLFYSDKLDLRYTNYNNDFDSRVFIRVTLKETDKTVMYLSSEAEEKSRLLYEQIQLNDALTQQKDALTQQNGILAQQNDALTRQNDVLAQQNDALSRKISDIYASNTWKAGNRLKKVFRFFIQYRGHD